MNTIRALSPRRNSCATESLKTSPSPRRRNPPLNRPRHGRPTSPNENGATMTLTKNNFLLLVIPLLLLTAAAPSRAASNGIRDEAHFFSPGAVTQAQQTIDQIERRHSKDVMVETLP